MSKDLIVKKLEQMKTLLAELSELGSLSYAEFSGKFTSIRSAERNFQLLVELACDINGYLAAELGAAIPETYRESFKTMVKFGVLPRSELGAFVKSSNLRNILVHEYDFDEDNFIFYKSFRKFLPLYKSYIVAIGSKIKNLNTTT